jgi:hypothetical protein
LTTADSLKKREYRTERKSIKTNSPSANGKQVNLLALPNKQLFRMHDNQK